MGKILVKVAEKKIDKEFGIHQPAKYAWMNNSELQQWKRLRRDKYEQVKADQIKE